MTSNVVRLRRVLAPLLSLTLIGSFFVLGHGSLASVSADEEVVSRYHFTKMEIQLPSGQPQQTLREVNPMYERIVGWISAVGAAIAINDLDGDGLSNDLCVVDPRTDRVAVTPTPDSRTSRYRPFFVDPAPLPRGDRTAPMGCVPGDFNEDGRMDLLVYYWGRTPIVFLTRSDAETLDAAAYRPVELVPGPVTGDGKYHGPRWNSNAVAVDDFDGDGHADIFIGNYFPDSDLLGKNGRPDVVMNDSMSQAFNGGENVILRFEQATAGPEPDVKFGRMADLFSEDVAHGWTLAAGARDLDGDLLPELYVANDFGPDRLLYNRSAPGEIRFEVVEGERGPADPKSMAIGHDSFKGMGIDFGDMDGDGMVDMFVSNISTTFGIIESNLAFFNSAADQAGVRAALHEGAAPFEERSARLGIAWAGWGWDVKFADFDNSGSLELVQANGFLKGEVNRWPQLQELATANDELVRYPWAWPRLEEGDDIAGHQRTAFFAKRPDGKYADINDELGIGDPTPSRGVAVGDATGDGAPDFAVARQWEAPVYYRNDAPSQGEYLGLRLVLPVADDGTTTAGEPVLGSPAVGAQVRVTTSQGNTYLGHVDGGSGHSGKRSSEIHIGLGDVDPQTPVRVELRWRDRQGQVHDQELRLSPGWHDVELSARAQEVGAR